MDIPRNSLIDTLLLLNIKDLEQTCSTNRDLRRICSSPDFWRQKYKELRLEYPGDLNIQTHIRNLKQNCRQWLEELYSNLDSIRPPIESRILDGWFLDGKDLVITYASAMKNNDRESVIAAANSTVNFRNQILPILRSKNIRVYGSKRYVRPLNRNDINNYYEDWEPVLDNIITTMVFTTNLDVLTRFCE